MRKTSAAAEWQRSRTAPRPPSTFSEKEALGRVASGENSGAQHTLDQTIAIPSMQAQALHACFRQLRTRGHACHHWLYCSRVLPTARLLQPFRRPGVGEVRSCVCVYIYIYMCACVFVCVCACASILGWIRDHAQSACLFEQTPRVEMLADCVVLSLSGPCAARTAGR